MRTVTPYRSDQPAGRDGFIQLLHAEWTKFRTVRAWMVAWGAVAVMIVLLSYLGASSSHSGSCIGTDGSTPVCTVGHPPVPTGPDGKAVADSFTYVHQSLDGTGGLTVRVSSLTGGHAAGGAVSVSPDGEQNLQPGLAPWAKAGIIVQKDTRSGSAYAAVMVTGSHGVRMK